jgi:uncharacterized protein YjeT (DUF2065 family)
MKMLWLASEGRGYAFAAVADVLATTAWTAVLSATIIGFIACYLIAFGVVAMVVPSRASRYLLSFASSWRIHVLELAIRFVAGVAFVGYAQHMRYPSVLHALGWILIITTLGLAVLPWRWHQRFAQRSVPGALRFLRPMGVVAAGAGIVLMWALAPAFM